MTLIGANVNIYTHPDSFGILEKPNMSMWSDYRALRPRAQVLPIRILIHIRVPSHWDLTLPVSPRIHIRSQPDKINSNCSKDQHCCTPPSSSQTAQFPVFPQCDVPKWWHTGREWGSPSAPPLCSLWDQPALFYSPPPGSVRLQEDPGVCALHLRAWRSAEILTAVRRGDEKREGRKREWKRDGIGREGWGGTTRADDGCFLAPALPSVHQGCKTLCGAGERTEGGWRARRVARGGGGGWKWKMEEGNKGGVKVLGL